ncbi:MAG: sensor histidine kinase [Limisphaerales bacterium]
MNKLRWWTSLGVTTVVGLSVLSFAVRYLQVTADWTSQDTLALARDKTVRLGRWIRVDASTPEFESSIDDALADRAPGWHLAFLDAHGRILTNHTTPAFPLPDFAIPDQHLRDPVSWTEPHAEWARDARGRRYAVAWLPLGSIRVPTTPPTAWSLAAVGEPTNDHRRATLGSSMLIRSVGLALGSGVLTFLLVGLWTRSLASAADAAERIAQGGLGLQTLDVPRRDSELRRLVLAFNTLMERLRALHAAQQRFIADAAHELRTPLTILRGEVQVALRRDRDPGKYRAVLQSNLEEVIRLSGLVEALLTLARMDARQLPSQGSTIPVTTACREVASKLAPLAESKGVRIEVSEPADPEPRLDGDPASLHRIVLNLVENAVRYSSPEDTVRIVVQTDPAELRIRVVDEGPGIAPEHLPHIFDRFYRIESARNRASGGTGLGLAIARSLTESLGGRIAVTSELGHGATFTLTFPVEA